MKVNLKKSLIILITLLMIAGCATKPVEKPIDYTNISKEVLTNIFTYPYKDMPDITKYPVKPTSDNKGVSEVDEQYQKDMSKCFVGLFNGHVEVDKEMLKSEKLFSSLSTLQITLAKYEGVISVEDIKITGSEVNYDFNIVISINSNNQITKQNVSGSLQFIKNTDKIDFIRVEFVK